MLITLMLFAITRGIITACVCKQSWAISLCSGPSQSCCVGHSIPGRLSLFTHVLSISDHTPQVIVDPSALWFVSVEFVLAGR